MASASVPIPALLSTLTPRSILTWFFASPSPLSQDANAGLAAAADGDDMDAMEGVTTTTTTHTATAGATPGSSEELAKEAAIRAQGMDGILLSGQTVRMFRQRLGVSVVQLAEHIGYSRSRVHAWEAGEEIPPAMYLPILRYLGDVRKEREEWRELARTLGR